MRRLHHPLSLVAALLVAAGCGPDPEAPLGFDVRRDPLLAPELERACLSLYAGRQSCEVLRVSAVPGLYEAQIALSGEAEVASTLFGVRAGVYTPVVWGMDGAGRALGFGCQPGGIEVEDGVRADVTITVDENPDPDRGRPCPRQ
jgi:hypothetical protein